MSIFTLLFFFSLGTFAAEEIIYEDVDGNVLSKHIRSDDEIMSGGFEPSCHIPASDTPCSGFGGGFLVSVSTCVDITPDQIEVLYYNNPVHQTYYKSQTVFTCDGNLITKFTVREKNCQLAPGDVLRWVVFEQFSTTQYKCN